MTTKADEVAKTYNHMQYVLETMCGIYEIPSRSIVRAQLQDAIAQYSDAEIAYHGEPDVLGIKSKDVTMSPVDDEEIKGACEMFDEDDEYFETHTVEHYYPEQDVKIAVSGSLRMADDAFLGKALGRVAKSLIESS